MDTSGVLGWVDGWARTHQAGPGRAGRGQAGARTAGGPRRGEASRARARGRAGRRGCRRAGGAGERSAAGTGVRAQHGPGEVHEAQDDVVDPRQHGRCEREGRDVGDEHRRREREVGGVPMHRCAGGQLCEPRVDRSAGRGDPLRAVDDDLHRGESDDDAPGRPRATRGEHTARHDEQRGEHGRRTGRHLAAGQRVGDEGEQQPTSATALPRAARKGVGRTSVMVGRSHGRGGGLRGSPAPGPAGVAVPPLGFLSALDATASRGGHWRDHSRAEGT